MKKAITITTTTMVAWAGSASASFLLDFNSNQSGGGAATAGSPELVPAVNHEAGYASYWINHEAAGFVDPATAGSYNTNFALTGPASITLLPSWPNSTGNTVRQSIGRSDGQANSWTGNNVDLLRDWIGTDSRPVNWDGTTGTPTYFTLTLGGLPAGMYDFIGYHHDVENMNSLFTAEVSTDGGATFGPLVNGRITNSLPGGIPAENEVLAGSGVNVPGGDPADLSSTMTLNFDANGTDDVVLRYAPLGNGDVHRMFFAINGFELNQVPEPSTGLFGLLGLGFLIRRRR